MTVPHAKIIRLIVLLSAILFPFSFTKDLDLLSDYVIDDAQSVLGEVKAVAIKNEPIIVVQKKWRFIENAFAFVDKIYFSHIIIRPNLN